MRKLGRLLRRPAGKKTNWALEGNALVITLVTALVIGLILSGYLNLVSNQNISTTRALAWNSAIPVLEAGIEEALAHIHRRDLVNLGADGWVRTEGGLYAKERSLEGSSHFEVTIEPVDPPVILATGYVLAPLSSSANLNPHYVRRTVRVRTRHDSMFSKPMLAKEKIDLNGKNIQTDSFDSADPLYNTNGQYDPSKTRDHGDIATNSGLVDSLKSGNARIKGHASTGPGGTVAIGSNGTIGSQDWVDSGKKGVEPGYVSDDMNFEFPDVLPPFDGGYSTPAGGTVNDVTYNYVLGTGNYKLNTIKGSVLVVGQATLWVTDIVQFTGNDFIKIAPGGSLKLYVSATKASIGGKGVINATGYAANFQYYGLPSNTSLALAGNAAFAGVIYAPQAEFQLDGGGNTVYDFVGASISRTVKMNGHFNFHYDEDLGRHGPYRPYVADSWNEI